MTNVRAFSFSAVKAITLDLDDTLWPIAPVMIRAEQLMYQWLQQHTPQVADTYSIEALRALRDAVAQQNPDIAHDFSEQRIRSLRLAMLPLGCTEQDVQTAFGTLFAARNEVQLFDGALSALQALSTRFPLAALSNGNAELRRVGLAEYFQVGISAREFGAAKPDAGIFAHACDTLGFAPHEVLHVGDHWWQDVAGAKQAGMMAAWIHPQHDSPQAVRELELFVEPDLEFSAFAEIARLIG